ncbi:50S ribosomal protein L31 [bacterium]|nr:50S ribosomal protein L31 [bacterium]|tara:strand:+ start:199 stop:486 length:288 start_codon:yes stop_codon:yes gene_type:complete
MKKDIHPPYYSKSKVTCVCGASFEVGSIQEKIEVEICSMCHPLYTGEEKIIDTAGRVERFKTRSAVAKAMADKRAKVTTQPKQKSVKTKKKGETA